MQVSPQNLTTISGMHVSSWNLKSSSENSNSNNIASFTHEMSVFIDISREHTNCGSGAGAFSNNFQPYGQRHLLKAFVLITLKQIY